MFEVAWEPNAAELQTALVPLLRYKTAAKSTSITVGWAQKIYMMDCRGASFVWLGLSFASSPTKKSDHSCNGPPPPILSPPTQKKTFLLFVGKSRKSEVKPQEQHVIGCCGVKGRVERPNFSQIKILFRSSPFSPRPVSTFEKHKVWALSIDTFVGNQ